MDEVVNINKEILQARANNYAELIAAKFDEICQRGINDIDAYINIENGDWLMQAVEEVAQDIKAGKYDNMLMPVENNK